MNMKCILVRRLGLPGHLHSPHSNSHDWTHTLSEERLRETYALGLMSPRSAIRQCLGLLTDRDKSECSVFSWAGCGEGEGKTLFSFTMITSGDEDDESIVFLSKKIPNIARWRWLS